MNLKLSPSNCRVLKSLGFLLGLALLGCGSKEPPLDATVDGTVTIDDELAPRGLVTFNPVNKGPVAVGPIREDGSYSVRVGQGNVTDPDAGKLRSGDYVVTVIVTGEIDKSTTVNDGGPPATGQRLTAAKYSSPTTSDLKYKVKPGRNVIVLKLDGVSADPPEEPDQTEGKPQEETVSAPEKQPAAADAAPPSEEAAAEPAAEGKGDGAQNPPASAAEASEAGADSAAPTEESKAEEASK